MKIIISHDVDHITAREHNFKLLVKFVIRATIELYNKIISLQEYKNRIKSIYTNKWQNIEEIIKFEEKNGIRSTFFIGMANGIGLEYSLEQAFYWAKKIDKLGYEVGVHGIAYDSLDDMKKEYDLLKNLLNKEIGIRMHYLRNSVNTLKYLEKIGYIFDSSVLVDKNPYKIGKMWEFPLHIMEGNIFYQDGKRWTSKNLEEYKIITIDRINELEKKGIKYMTLLFHDIYFSDNFSIWKNWYIWIIQFLKDKGYNFITYNEAIEELEK